jgi:hypothetical protein
VGNMESWERTVKKIREKSDTSSSSFIVIHPPSLPSIYTSSLSPSSLSSLRVPPLLPAQTSRRHIFWLPWERFWWWHAPIVFFSFKKNSFYYYYIPPLSFFKNNTNTWDFFFPWLGACVCGHSPFLVTWFESFILQSSVYESTMTKSGGVVYWRWWPAVSRVKGRRSFLCLEVFIFEPSAGANDLLVISEAVIIH